MNFLLFLNILSVSPINISTNHFYNHSDVNYHFLKSKNIIFKNSKNKEISAAESAIKTFSTFPKRNLTGESTRYKPGEKADPWPVTTSSLRIKTDLAKLKNLNFSKDRTVLPDKVSQLVPI